MAAVHIHQNQNQTAATELVVVVSWHKIPFSPQKNEAHIDATKQKKKVWRKWCPAAGRTNFVEIKKKVCRFVRSVGNGGA